MDTNMDMDTVCIISQVETLHNIHIDTNMDMDKECIINHMECGEILQSIISIQNLLTDENQYL